MATYQPPKVSTQYIFFVSLVSQANTKIMQVNPTIASGDFKVSIDGGALANLGTLPTVTPAGGSMVKITLSTSEMAGANATVVCLDAAGAEWCDLTINLQTAARQIDDLAYPATSGRSLVVDAAGLVDANMVKAGATGAGNTITTSGGVTLPAATLASTTNITSATGVAITSNIKKNQALAKFQFLMTDSTTNAPKTGLVVTCTRSIDGGAYGAGTLANVTEIAVGTYTVDFGAGDLNGNVIVIQATAAGANATFERLVTQP